MRRPSRVSIEPSSLTITFIRASPASTKVVSRFFPRARKAMSATETSSRNSYGISSPSRIPTSREKGPLPPLWQRNSTRNNQPTLRLCLPELSTVKEVNQAARSGESFSETCLWSFDRVLPETPLPHSSWDGCNRPDRHLHRRYLLRLCVV